MSNFPGRLAIIVPIHHDPHRPKVDRADRIELLRRCLSSVIESADLSEATGSGFSEVTIVVVDDHSPMDPQHLLNPGQRVRIRWLKSLGAKGQAGALNFAIATIDADAFAFTDSDCVVARDWLQRMATHYRAYPDHGGVGGPHWLFSTGETRWSRMLTRQESALMQFLAEDEIDRGMATSTRIDCRNLSLRADYARRLTEADSLFRNGSFSVSGQAAYLVKRQIASGEASIGFAESMLAYHEPVSSLLGQVSTYYSRGRWSAFDAIYASIYGDLFTAFRHRFGKRHFVSPVLSASVSVFYAWTVHLAYWAGIMRRRWLASRNGTLAARNYPQGW